MRPSEKAALMEEQKKNEERHVALEQRVKALEAMNIPTVIPKPEAPTGKEEKKAEKKTTKKKA